MPSGRMMERLPNGLTVVVEERRSSDTVALQLAARVGVREDEALAGITTLTSQMMFRGTSRRPSETAVQRAAAAVGGTIGRNSGSELSLFASRMPAAEVDTGFDLLADLALDPLFDEETLARQKQTALQDLAQRRANPSLLIADLYQEAAYTGHPAGRPVFGTPESVQAVTRDALVAHYRRYWGAANLVLAVVGHITPAEALAKARHSFGGLPAGTVNERPVAQLTSPESLRTVRGEAGQAQMSFRLAFVAPGLRDPDRYPMNVLNSVTGGSSGRFYEQVRGARGLAYVADSAYGQLTDAGAWFATAGVDPKNYEVALDVVRDVILGLRARPVSAEEVAAKITELTGRQILNDELNADRANRIAQEVLLGTPPIEEFVRRIAEVTPADIQRVAGTYLDPDRATLVVVGPPAT